MQQCTNEKIGSDDCSKSKYPWLHADRINYQVATNLYKRHIMNLYHKHRSIILYHAPMELPYVCSLSRVLINDVVVDEDSWHEHIGEICLYTFTTQNFIQTKIDCSVQDQHKSLQVKDNQSYRVTYTGVGKNNWKNMYYVLYCWYNHNFVNF